jgi:hypothetical protein
MEPPSRRRVTGHHVSRYHLVRFLLDEAHLDALVADDPAAFMARMRRVFANHPPPALLAGLARLRPALFAAAAAADSPGPSAALAKHDRWVARRDAGNRAAQERRRAATTAAAAAEEAAAQERKEREREEQERELEHAREQWVPRLSALRRARAAEIERLFTMT